MGGVGVRLGLDTATPYLCLALWSDQEGVLASRRRQVGREHAGRLLPELEALLEDAGVARGSLQAVTAGVGPGSYTGVRVGLAAARALGVAWKVPVGGASTLAQIAWGSLRTGEEGQVAAAAIDARRDAVYLAVYRRQGSGLLELAPAHKLPRDEARRAWPGARWLEDLPPDAVWAAMQPPGGAKAEAVYL